MINNISTCTYCSDLNKVLSQIDCTLRNMIKNKYNVLSYNVTLSFNDRMYRDLIRYKRIITNRLFNPTYPSKLASVDVILTKASLLIDKNKCSVCPECFPTL